MADRSVNAFYEEIFDREVVIYVCDPTVICDYIVSKVLLYHVCWLYVAKHFRVGFCISLISDVLLQEVVNPFWI